MTHGSSLARMLARGLATGLAVLLACMFVGFAYARTPWGARRLAAVIEAQLDRHFAGDVFLGSVALTGLSGVRLRHVLLSDDAGHAVIAASEVDVTLDPVALLRGTLEVDHLRVAGGRVEIAMIAGGHGELTIARIFEPREAPKTRAKKEPGPPVELPPDPPVPIVVKRLELEDVAYRQAATPGGAPEVLVRRIDASLSGRWDDVGATLVLALRGDALAPVQGALAVDVDASFAGDLLRANPVRVSLADTSLFVSGAADMRRLVGSARVQGSAGPGVGGFSGLDLPRLVHMAGDVEFAPQRVATGMELWVENAGHVTLQAGLDPRSTGLQITAHLVNVDPGAYLEPAPAGRISGTVAVEGTLAPRRLDVAVDLAEGRVAASRVGPARVRATLTQDALHLREAWVEVPGAGVSVVGDAAPGDLNLDARLQGRDLARTAAFLADVTGGEKLPLAGRGDVRLHLSGSPPAPEASYRLDFPEVRWSARALRGVSLAGHVALARGGGLPGGSVSGTVAGLDAGRLQARQLVLSAARGDDGAFSLELHGLTRVAGRKLAASAISAEGKVEPGRLDLSRLELTYPEGRVHLRAPAALQTGDGSLRIENLDLDGPGRIRISGQLEDGAFDADVHLKGVRLSRLPRALLPGDARGNVDVDARLRGRSGALRGHVGFDVRGASFGKVQDLAARGEVDLGQGRAAGRLRAAMGGVGAVTGTFDLPIAPGATPASAPVFLDLAVGPVNLSALGRALDAELPAGTLRALAKAKGRIGSPDAELRVQVEDLRPSRVSRLPPASVHLTGALEKGLATIDADAWVSEQRLLRLHAAAPLDPRALRDDPVREIRHLLDSPRSVASGEVRGLDLALVGQLAGIRDVRGAAAADIDVRGPIRDPRGTVRLDLRGGPIGPLQELLAAVQVNLEDQRTHVAMDLTPGEQPLEHVSLDAGASIRDILDGKARGSTPVHLLVEIPETQLQELAPRDAKVAGTVRASGRFEGTLEDLPGALRVVASDVAISGEPLGSLEVSLQQDRAAEVKLAAIDSGRGTLLGELSLARAISPLAVLRDPAKALDIPAVLKMNAADLSLAPLAMVPAVRRASGKVDLDVQAQGSLLYVEPHGTVSLAGGQVVMQGGTVYEQVALQARLTADEFQLGKLEAHAHGKGKLLATGTLQRRRGAPDSFSLHVGAEAFPIAGEGGILARVSADGKLTGTAGRAGIDGTLQVDSARIELPEKPPRELQSVGRPPDFVIVTGPEAERRESIAHALRRERQLPVTLHVKVPGRFFVVGPEVQAELAADLTLRRLPTGALAADGTVGTRRGQVKALGRTFVVEEAQAFFTGEEPIDPRIVATLRYDTPGVKAWMDVSGTARHPQVDLRSSPPLSDSEIALLIATGRSTLPGQTGGVEANPGAPETTPGTTAASVAGAFAADRLRQALGNKLPLDVLTLETSSSGARLEAGKYVSERLYLGYSRNLGATTQGTNANEVRGEYEISGNVSLQSRYGDRGNGGLDLVWEKTLPTPTQKRERRGKPGKKEGPSEAPPPLPEGSPGAGPGKG